MENKNTISVVLPLKTRTAYDFESFFDKSIESLKNQKDEFDELVIVHSTEEQLIKFLTFPQHASILLKTRSTLRRIC